MNAEQRFWAKVKKSDGCCLWTGARDKQGYGKFRVTVNGRVKYWNAHRYAFELLKGKEPGEFCVCHRCDNPPCVNPDHIFLGTKQDNATDRETKGRGVVPCLVGGLNPAATLNADQVREIYADGRSQRVIAIEYGINQSTVSRILTGKRRTIDTGDRRHA